MDEKKVRYLEGDLCFSASELKEDEWGIICKHNESGYSNFLSIKAVPIPFIHHSKDFIKHVVSELRNTKDLALCLYPLNNHKNKDFCFAEKSNESSYLLYSDYLLLKYIFREKNKELKEFKALRLWEILTKDIALFVPDEPQKKFSGEFTDVGKFLNDSGILEIDNEIKSLVKKLSERDEALIGMIYRTGFSEFSKNKYQKKMEEYEFNYDPNDSETWLDAFFPPQYSFSKEANKLVQESYESVSNHQFINKLKELDLHEFVSIYALSFLDENVSSVIAPYFCLKNNKKSSFFADFCSIIQDVEGDYEVLEAFYSSVMNYSELVEDHDTKYLKELTSSPETGYLEFKSQARYDFPFKKTDRRNYFDIVKNICAFINAEGGKVLVGYHENNEQFVGIKVTDEENRGMKGPDTDKMSDDEFIDWWELFIRQQLKNHTEGYSAGEMIKFEFPKINDLICAVISVEPLIDKKDGIWCRDIKGKYSEKEEKYIHPMVYFQRQGNETVIVKKDYG